MQTVVEAPFRIDSIVAAIAPEGSDGVWHRYVITQGSNAGNSITGLRPGTREEVIFHLDQMVERLNQRFSKQQAKRK